MYSKISKKPKNVLLFYFQVPPAELEDLLRTIPDVADVAVIGNLKI